MRRSTGRRRCGRHYWVLFVHKSSISGRVKNVNFYCADEDALVVGQGAKSQFGPTLPTKLPSGHCFASCVQTPVSVVEVGLGALDAEGVFVGSGEGGTFLCGRSTKNNPKPKVSISKTTIIKKIQRLFEESSIFLSISEFLNAVNYL